MAKMIRLYYTKIKNENMENADSYVKNAKNIDILLIIRYSLNKKNDCANVYINDEHSDNRNMKKVFRDFFTERKKETVT